MRIIKIIKIKCFYPPRILDNTDASILVYKFRPEKTWFQYVRRVYATAINFPCISTLGSTINTMNALPISIEYMM